ncbi:MAG: hypothetical protein R2713_21885 [Ilumatobacteraceae bacterium]
MVEGVWGDDEIDANGAGVRRLSAPQVDEPFGTATIQTVRGVGYRVDADR